MLGVRTGNDMGCKFKDLRQRFLCISGDKRRSFSILNTSSPLLRCFVRGCSLALTPLSPSTGSFLQQDGIRMATAEHRIQQLLGASLFLQPKLSSTSKSITWVLASPPAPLSGWCRQASLFSGLHQTTVSNTTARTICIFRRSILNLFDQDSSRSLCNVPAKLVGPRNRCCGGGLLGMRCMWGLCVTRSKRLLRPSWLLASMTTSPLVMRINCGGGVRCMHNIHVWVWQMYSDRVPGRHFYTDIGGKYQKSTELQ